MREWRLIFPEFGIDDPYLDGIFHHCQDVMDARFLHDISAVFFHGLRAHAQNNGYLVHGIAFNQLPEDLIQRRPFSYEWTEPLSKKSKAKVPLFA